MAYVIAFANHKGGVGKTTSVHNLATALAQQGRRVCAVDLDPQANLTRSAGAERADLAYIEELLLASGTPETLTALVQMPGGAWLIATSPRLADIVPAYQAHPAYADGLGRILDPIETRFDYVPLDTPPGINQWSGLALLAADGVVIPAQPHGLGKPGGQAAGVLDGAAGDDQAHRRRKLATQADGSAFRASTRARVIVRTDWRPRRAPAGRLRYLPGSRCRFDLVVTDRLALGLDEPASTRLDGVMPRPAARRGLKGQGTRDSSAWRVVRVPVTGLRAVLVTPYRTWPGVPSFQALWHEVTVTAKPTAECHSGPFNVVAGTSRTCSRAPARGGGRARRPPGVSYGRGRTRSSSSSASSMPKRDSR